MRTGFGSSRFSKNGGFYIKISMLANSSELIRDFAEVCALAGVPISEVEIRHEVIKPPHLGLALPSKVSAVYVFSLASKPNVVLKVGKVGTKSSARFVSQHYLPASCNSNLAKSICTGQDAWALLGIPNINDKTVGPWLRENTDRDHFFIEKEISVVSLLESFLQCRLKPLFEG